MNIELSPETLQALQRLMEERRFASPDEAIRAAVSRLAAEAAGGQAAGRAFAPFPKKVDVDELAAAQGVQPVDDLSKLRADFWPEGESVEEFLATIYALREAGGGVRDPLNG